MSSDSSGAAPSAPPPPVSRGISVAMIVFIVCAVVVVVAMLLAALLLSALEVARETARNAMCSNNMRRIGIAMQSYQVSYGSFPPAYVADETGKPMHSWRVLLLPFLEDPQATAVYELYRFDEPWDSPHNSALAGEMPRVFKCMSDAEGDNETNVLAVVGDETMWRGAQPMAQQEIKDGARDTIALVEVVGAGINWLEPRDMTFEQALQPLNAESKPPGISSHHDSAHVVCADGSVHFLADDTPPKTLRALLTAAGDEEVKLEDLER